MKAKGDLIFYGTSEDRLSEETGYGLAMSIKHIQDYWGNYF